MFKMRQKQLLTSIEQYSKNKLLSHIHYLYIKKIFRCVSGMNELLCWTIKGEQRYPWTNTLWHFEGSRSLRGMNLLKMTLLHGYISVAPPDPNKIIIWWRILSMSNVTMNLSPDSVGIHLGKTVVILIYFYWTTDAVLYN